MKKSRHQKIVEIITEQDVETQEELADCLREAGFHVTQATVSRDIRELKLSKVPDGHGRQKYATADKDIIADRDKGSVERRYIHVLREGFASMDRAQNLVVIRTVSGMAMAVAAALDAMEFDEVLGCIAGDDTIMVASRTEEEAGALIHKIQGMLDR